MTVSIKGGDRARDFLAKLKEQVGRGGKVRVGFLEGSTYPDGTPVPMVAATQEFGGSIEVPEHTQDLYFKQGKNGEVGNRFVPAGKANFAQSVTVPAHTITIPSRPFFRTMLTEDGPTWGPKSGKVLKAADFNVDVALNRMGEYIKGKLQGSIRELVDPPLAPSTIRAKGFAKPLIDTGHMLNSVDFEVEDGA